MLNNPENQLLGSKANNHVEICIPLTAVCEDRASHTRDAFPLTHSNRAATQIRNESHVDRRRPPMSNHSLNRSGSVGRFRKVQEDERRRAIE